MIQAEILWASEYWEDTNDENTVLNLNTTLTAENKSQLYRELEKYCGVLYGMFEYNFDEDTGLAKVEHDEGYTEYAIRIRECVGE